MKKSITSILLASSILFTSCIGSFSAFNGLRDWNEGITDSKFGNELIFIALNIIPVYGIAMFGDMLIFNAIEFWGGDNPIAMQEGDSETRTIVSKGNTYEITATQNRFHVTIIEGDMKGKSSDLVYIPTDKSWNIEKEDGELIKLASLKKGLLMAHLPDNNSITIPQNLTRLQTLGFLETELVSYENCQYAELN